MKFVHAATRTTDLDKTIRFYEQLGMHESRRRELPDLETLGDRGSACLLVALPIADSRTSRSREYSRGKERRVRRPQSTKEERTPTHRRSGIGRPGPSGTYCRVVGRRGRRIARSGAPHGTTRPVPNLTLTAPRFNATNAKEFSMGFRRRTRRRALVVGAVAGGAMAHHTSTQAAAQEQAPAEDYQEQPQYAPPPADPADEIEHLAQLHASGALTDDEFAAAKAKALGT